MLLFLLLFLCVISVTTQTTIWPATTYRPSTSTSTSTSTLTTEGKLSPLQLVATPDYPVAAGQRVNLHCDAFSAPDSVTWSWQRWVNKTWHESGTGRDLILTEPEQSGIYRCSAESRSQKGVSANHTVYIISMHLTVGENLGIAAVFLSLLALIINFAVVFWLCWQRRGSTATITNTAAKGVPGPEKSPKGGLPQTEMEGDYMNYTNTNPAYTDLDPTNVTEENVYSCLS